ncbi:hypothetical protein HDE68_001402 [Pedobacter cryoconitis]|uniref:DUF4374 domain-containing protein n=1 Tax=Pedobacter cryoconitis TaxID=188932 RepID=A0A7W9DYS8_9SPHI|nr:hypothetical protein [Pedobacter cryoconitis]MBB5635514.1 hypothetical protein [Pedobacter cryoconitis]
MNRYLSTDFRLLNRIRFLFIFLLFASCEGNKKKEDFKYGLIVYDQVKDANRFVPVYAMDKGIAEYKGVNVPGTTIAIYDKCYFLMDGSDHSFLKYRATAEGLVLEQTIDMKAIPWEPYSSWVNRIDAHTILMGSVVEEQFRFTVIDLKEMKILRHGLLAVPPAPKGVNYTGMSAQFVKDRLFVFYTFQKGLMREHVTPPDDAVYTAIFKYPSLELEKTFSDQRTTWPGSYNIWSSNSLVLNDTVYVLGQPGGRTGNHPTAPSAILRLNKGDKSFDPGYMFKLGNHGGQEAYTLYNLGHGLAITKVVESAEIIQFDDYMMKRISHYELVDLRRQKKIKLVMPPVLLDFLMNVTADENYAYLSVYQENDKSQIWIYNLRSGILKRGATVNGQIIRIDKLAD